MKSNAVLNEVPHHHHELEDTPNHNPLIGCLPGDTYNNIHDVLAAVQLLAESHDIEADGAQQGMSMIIRCATAALEYETHRATVACKEA